MIHLNAPAGCDCAYCRDHREDVAWLWSQVHQAAQAAISEVVFWFPVPDTRWFWSQVAQAVLTKALEDHVCEATSAP